MVMEAISVQYASAEQLYDVGAVSFDTTTGVGAFEYTPEFIRGIELAPLTMPLAAGIYRFPVDFATFAGVIPIAPDDFGNAVLNAWMASRGRRPEDITPLQRLQYTGKRGMGALEFAPATRLKSLNASQQVDINALVVMAQDILDQRSEFQVSLNAQGRDDAEAMLALLSVGMSAGGARPKASAFNDDFSQALPGRQKYPPASGII